MCCSYLLLRFKGTKAMRRHAAPLELSSRARSLPVIRVIIIFLESMNNREEKLKRIKWIKVPHDLKIDMGSFTVNENTRLPIEIPEGQKHIEEKDVTVEAIIAGMLTLIAYDENNKDFEFYRNFVLSVQPDIAEELNKAAIVKQQSKDYDFAEELFLSVYHILPQSASCINLATLYSYISVDAEEKEDDERYDWALRMAKLTLLDGLKRFGEDEAILSEISSFEGYMGNLEDAKEYAERYMKVASEGERKKEMKEFLQRINETLSADQAFKEAYDYIMLNMPEKALSCIESFLSFNPDVWNGYFLKAWALRKMKRYSEARDALLMCIKKGESNSDIYNELSICELEEGNRELAKTYLDTAIDLDPENLTAMSNLAFLHLEDKEYDEARFYLERARSLSSSDEIITNLISRYEALTGEKIKENIKEESYSKEEVEELEKIRSGRKNNMSDEDKRKEEHHCCGHHNGEEGHHCCHEEEGREHHCHHSSEDSEHQCCGHHNREEGHCCHHHEREDSEHQCCGHHHDDDHHCCHGRHE